MTALWQCLWSQTSCLMSIAITSSSTAGLCCFPRDLWTNVHPLSTTTFTQDLWTNFYQASTVVDRTTTLLCSVQQGSCKSFKCVNLTSLPITVVKIVIYNYIWIIYLTHTHTHTRTHTHTHTDFYTSALVEKNNGESIKHEFDTLWK